MNSWIDRSERIATNNFFLCSPLDKNFGVIHHRTLRDGYVIQLYQHCWEIALVKLRTLGLIFKHCNTVCALFYFSTNSCIDRTERIALRWFRTLHTIYFSARQELWSDSSSHIEGWLYDPIILALLGDCTSESTDPRPHF